METNHAVTGMSGKLSGTQRRHHHMLLLLIGRFIGRARMSTRRSAASGPSVRNVQQIRIEGSVGILLHLTSVQHHQVPCQTFRNSTSVVAIARNVRVGSVHHPHLLLLLLLQLLMTQLKLHLHVLLGVDIRLRDGMVSVGRGILQRRVLIHFNVQQRFLLFGNGRNRSVSVDRFGRTVQFGGAAVAWLRLLPLWHPADEADDEQDESNEQNKGADNCQGDGRRVRHQSRLLLDEDGDGSRRRLQ